MRNIVLINKQAIPSSPSENNPYEIWEDGKLIAYEDVNFKIFYFGHESQTVWEDDPAGGDEKIEKTITYAFPVQVSKPYDLGTVKNAALMSAYGLNSQDDLIALNADIQKKFQENPSDLDVRSYNEFVDWVADGYNGVIIDELAAAKKTKLVEITDYDSSPDVNLFYLNGLGIWLDKATRVGLMNSISIEKAAGKENSTLWLGTISITVPCDQAIQMLSALEIYALDCYNKTAEHKKNVESLTEVSEVKSYDYTTGYPEKLQLTIQ